MTVLAVIVGFPLFGRPRENGYCSFRIFRICSYGPLPPLTLNRDPFFPRRFLPHNDIFPFLHLLGPKILDAKIVHTSGKMFDFGGSKVFDFFGGSQKFDFGGRKISLTYVPI